MLVDLAALCLALTLGTPPAVANLAVDSVRRDSGRVVIQDSTIARARRTLARVGIGAEWGGSGSTRELADTTSDTTIATQRRHAVEYSEWYYKRLTIHKVASYNHPLFVAEYVLGDKPYNGTRESSTRSTHQAVAGGIGVLFGVNTVTGVWNLWRVGTNLRAAQGGRRMRCHARGRCRVCATAALAPEGEDDSFENSSDDRSRHARRDHVHGRVARQLSDDVPVEMSSMSRFYFSRMIS
jgi:hypothetical protein